MWIDCYYYYYYYFYYLNIHYRCRFIVCYLILLDNKAKWVFDFIDVKKDFQINNDFKLFISD